MKSEIEWLNKVQANFKTDDPVRKKSVASNVELAEQLLQMGLLSNQSAQQFALQQQQNQIGQQSMVLTNSQINILSRLIGWGQ